MKSLKKNKKIKQKYIYIYVKRVTDISDTGVLWYARLGHKTANGEAGGTVDLVRGHLVAPGHRHVVWKV